MIQWCRNSINTAPIHTRTASSHEIPPCNRSNDEDFLSRWSGARRVLIVKAEEWESYHNGVGQWKPAQSRLRSNGTSWVDGF
jgi:hypothetical protein